MVQIMDCSVASQYLDQYWLSVNCIQTTEILIEIQLFFIKDNENEFMVCKMSDILFWPQYVRTRGSLMYSYYKLDFKV